MDRLREQFLDTDVVTTKDGIVVDMKTVVAALAEKGVVMQ